MFVWNKTVRMKQKISIEIEFNPTKEAVDSYYGDVDCLIENELDDVLQNLRYGLDGFCIKDGLELKTWSGTNVKIKVDYV